MKDRHHHGPFKPGLTKRGERDENWLPRLFEAAGVPPDADLETIQTKMDTLANRVAPLTRRWWKWILLLQGVAVLVPVAWLRHPISVPVSWVAAATFLTVILFVSVNWWLRWRGMQKTWARARLVAEVARSLLCTRMCPRIPALQSFDVVPSLDLLRSVADRHPDVGPLEQWRTKYIENRVDDQLRYFAAKRSEAECQRQQLSRWGTLMLDLALAFAFAGVVVSLSPQGALWRRMLGDLSFDAVLGVAGVLAPLTLLLVQLLRGVQELNRRTARYAQQQEMLEQAKVRLMQAQTADEAMEIVDLTEKQLLAEVLEWYFHAETAELFFLRRGRDPSDRAVLAVRSEEHSRVFRFLRRTLGITSMAGLFLLRVILGRLPWIVGSGAAALMWIAYHQPSDVAVRDHLMTLARLADRNGQDWVPDSAKLQHGCVVIVHGLYGDISQPINESKGWPKLCARKITETLGDQAPDVCLVDWTDAAHTARFNKLGAGFGLSEQEDLLTDLAGVRPQAEEVGDLVAFRLAMMLVDDGHATLQKDQPLYLIGHSAGGFVVARVAVLLKRLGVAPHRVHVTILDTPAPDPEIISTLPGLYPDNTVDFYISSDIGGRVETLRSATFSSKIHAYSIPPEPETASGPAKASSIINSVQRAFHRASNVWVAHRYSFEWLMKTIERPQDYPGEGFNRSPFAKTAAARSAP